MLECLFECLSIGANGDSCEFNDCFVVGVKGTEGESAEGQGGLYSNPYTGKPLGSLEESLSRLLML